MKRNGGAGGMAWREKEWNGVEALESAGGKEEVKGRGRRLRVMADAEGTSLDISFSFGGY